MTEASSPNDRRGQHVAAVGFLLQLASLGALAGVAVASGSQAIGTVARFTMIGLPIWFVLFLVFKQFRRVRAEQLETSELRRSRAAGTDTAIFELDEESFLLEQNRLRWMIRWLLPCVTVLLALLLLVGHFVGWGWSLEAAFHSVSDGGLKPTREPTLMMWFVVGVGFLNFLYARYSMALGRLPDWRLLHAGAVCMAGNALVCLGLAIALMAGTSIWWAESLVAYSVRVAMIVLGLEFAGNFILDFYRPRQPNFVPRPSFDSRLLGLISDPGGIAKSIADTLNYQFGFEVSSNWFFQLLQRWLFPITVFTAVVIVMLSGVVILDADEQAVVERLGRPVLGPGRVLDAGFHLKWPVPIEVVRRAPVKRIGEIVIGEATDHEDEHGAVLWTQAHEYVPELMLLVASPELGEASARGSAKPTPQVSRSGAPQSVAVSLLMVSVPIEYRIKDLHKYLYEYTEPEKLLENVAHQRLSEYAASMDIDELMGPGRKKMNRDLQRAIQDRMDELNVGIEVVFVGFCGAHPPAEKGVAKAFQGAIAAQTNMLATINAAMGEAQKTLIAVAGTEARARELDEAIRARDRLRAEPESDSTASGEAQQLIEDLLMGNAEKGIPRLNGVAAARIAEARADASRLTSFWAAKVRAFATEVAAYQTAPTLYKQRKRLEVYEDIDDVRKFLIIGDPSTVKIVYESQEQGGLDRVLSEGVEQERKKGL
ncbi:MAG: hypothetical protein IID38_02215 [Planctomycetes bacterium]|nr:hypothetical protein [Planctomycetota bacterium]